VDPSSWVCIDSEQVTGRGGAEKKRKKSFYQHHDHAGNFPKRIFISTLWDYFGCWPLDYVHVHMQQWGGGEDTPGYVEKTCHE
jgi:hypothetical protein